MKTYNLLSYKNHPVKVILCLLLFLLPASFGLQAQTVSLSRQNARMAEVFEEIEKQTQMTIGYNESTIDANSRISVNITNKPISQAMADVLKGTDATFRIQGKQILIVTKTPSTPNTQQDKKQITGTVVDEQGEPVIGANVVEKGTTNGVITDIDGKFSMNVAENGSLEISYLGYATQSVNTKGKTNFPIALKEDSHSLEEVVVVGYGTQKKLNLTGSVEIIGGEKLENRPVTTVSQALQGQVSGANFTTGTHGFEPGPDMGDRKSVV